MMDTTTPEWRRVFQIVEKIKFGEARILFQDGRPIRVELVVKSIRLDHDDYMNDQIVAL